MRATCASTRIDRIHGGASRETYALRLRYRAAAGGRWSGALILRRDPPGSLIETDRRVEFARVSRLPRHAPCRCPKALWLEEDPAPLDCPFFVMEEVRGVEASPQALLAPPYAAAPRAKIGAAQVDDPRRDRDRPTRRSSAWSGHARAGRARTPAGGASSTTGRGVIDEDELEPQPIDARRDPLAAPASAAARAAGRASCTRDYRTGNFLVRPEGEIRAILDWEMAHLGDPLEDLAWGLNRGLALGARRPRGRPAAEGATRSAIWEAASGLRADPAPCSGGSSSRA